MIIGDEAEWVKTFLPYAPLILTIIGWYVANGASANREIRKERRAEVDACCKLLAETLSKARAYYTASADDPTAVRLSREIVFDLHRIIQRVERLESRCPKFDVMSTCAELHEAATGGDFESCDRVALAHNSIQIMTIEHWTHKTMDQLEVGFQETYR